MISDIGRPVTELRIQIMMIVALPRWKFTIVGGPYRLQRYRIRIFTRGRTEFIHFIVILFLENFVRQCHGRRRPIVVPKLHMLLIIFIDTAIPSFRNFFISPVFNQRRGYTPNPLQSCSPTFPFNSNIVCKISPPGLMINNTVRRFRNRTLTVSQTLQIRSGMIIGMIRCRTVIYRRNDHRLYRIIQIPENKPSDRL